MKGRTSNIRVLILHITKRVAVCQRLRRRVAKCSAELGFEVCELFLMAVKVDEMDVRSLFAELVIRGNAVAPEMPRVKPRSFRLRFRRFAIEAG